MVASTCVTMYGHQCMGVVHGCSAWVQCMGAVHRCSAWVQFMDTNIRAWETMYQNQCIGASA